MKFLRNMLRRILMITFLTITLTVVNLFAYTESNIEETKDTLIYTYEIAEEQEEDFLNNLATTVTKDKITAHLVDKSKSGGNKLYTTERSFSDSKILEKNSTEYILSQISQEYSYNSEDNFKGTLILDNESIQVREIKGDLYEYKVSLTKKYENFNRNDLDSIPKTIKEKNITYYLTAPSWEVTSTEIIDDREVPATYSGNMLYEGIAYARYPSTYEVSYTYKGTVEKLEESPIIYKITYEKEMNLTIPAILGSSGIIIVVVLFFFKKKRISIYNKQDNEYILIRKINIKNNIIDLNKYAHLIISNDFKIELDNKAFNKYKDQEIKVIYENTTKTIKNLKESNIISFK